MVNRQNLVSVTKVIRQHSRTKSFYCSSDDSILGNLNSTAKNAHATSSAFPLSWCFESTYYKKNHKLLYCSVFTHHHGSLTMAILTLNSFLTDDFFFSQNLQCLPHLQNGIANSEMFYLCPVNFYYKFRVYSQEITKQHKKTPKT